MQFDVPAYSQYLDIENDKWKDKGCGILCLQMLIDYWDETKKSSQGGIDALIEEGLKSGAYIPGTGWKHKGIVELAKEHGLDGENFDWADKNVNIAFEDTVQYLNRHPIITSIHKNLEPGSPGHLVVLTGYDKGMVMYNDPASKTREDIKRSVMLQRFLNGWKKRNIVVHPPECSCNNK